MLMRSMGFMGRAVRGIQRRRALDRALRVLRQSFSLQALREVVVRRDCVLLRVADGRTFAWKGEHANSLLTLPAQGDFESRESSLVRTWLRPGDVAIDVGANFGWYTTLMRQVLAGTGAVHAFEPVPEAFRLLGEHIALNPSPTPTVINKLAIGQVCGRSEMWIPRRAGRGTAFASLKQQDRLGRQDRVEVVVTTLGDYVESHALSGVALIKCDVEGAELLVVRGALRCMDAGVRALWIVETCDQHMARFGCSIAELVGLFQARDYLVCDIGEGGVLVDMKGKPSDHINNHVFVPRELVRPVSVGSRVILDRI